MPRRGFKALVRWYKASTLRVGPVELGVLELASEREVLVSHKDPVEALLRLAEEEARSARGDYLEVMIDDGEAKRIIGAAPRYTWSRPLSYRPEPLRRVGVIESLGGGGDLGNAKWYEVGGRFYVFEGKAQLLDDNVKVDAVVVETPSGYRLIKPSPASLRGRRSS